MSKRMYHPCHKLSVPTAKLFWCRHCMQMFEDAIARWKHSKRCHASPGFKHKDNDARVIQLYVKPDTVSYTSNIEPGQTVYHKPLVKKTSTDLKCVICGAKFFSLYDMRNHVKEPCQRSEIKQSVASTQIEFSDNEDDTESFSSLKIRRVESEDEEKISPNTALSVLAEASKHVESLSHSDIIIEEVIEEEVPQAVDSYPHISHTTRDSSGVQETSSVSVFQDSLTFDTKPEPEVVVAYPRPTANPELGTVIFTLQNEEGHQIAQDCLDLDIIQESLKETALTLPVGQVIQITGSCSSDKLLQFVIGFQGVIWPLEDNPVPHLTLKERTENAALFPPQPSTSHYTTNQEPTTREAPNITQIFTNSVDIHITNNIQAEILARSLGGNIVSSQEVATSPRVHNSSQQVQSPNHSLITNIKSENLSPETNAVTTGTVLDVEFIQNLLASQQSTSSEITGQKSTIHSLDSSSVSLVEALLRSGAVVPQTQVNSTLPVHISSQDTYTLPAKSEQILQSSLQEVNTMACGKQLADNLFGFGELTGEVVEPSAVGVDSSKETVTNTKDSTSTKDVITDLGISKTEAKSDLVKVDENEVIVPILFEKAGVKKFKVLARQMVEDDEDIRRPDSSDRESPNSTEQRKENINIDVKKEKKVKQKSVEDKSVKKSKVNVHTENKGNNLKSLKKLKVAKQTKTKQEHVYQAQNEKSEAKKTNDVKEIKKKVKLKLKLDHALKVTDAHVCDESEKVNTNLISSEAQKPLGSACDTVPKISPENVECKTTKSEEVIVECDKDGKDETVAIASNSSMLPSVNVACSVKLKRDPSIENLYKDKLSDESYAAMKNEIVANEGEISVLSDSSQVVKKTPECTNSKENLDVVRQLSTEESRQKAAADMVFNANIQVRKSGRLQSAKCASRYRGDYGIRVDTYKQLISRQDTVNECCGDTDGSCNSFESSEEMNAECRCANERVNETDEQAVANVVRECVRTASQAVDMIETGDTESCSMNSNINVCTCSARKTLERVIDKGLQKEGELERNICNQKEKSGCSDRCCIGESESIEAGASINVKSDNKRSCVTNTSEIQTKTVPCTSSMAGKDENPCKCDKHPVSCNKCCRTSSDTVNKLSATDKADISSHKEVSCGPDYLPGEFIAKEFIAGKVLSLRDTETDFDNKTFGYVHSVGKSVKRKRVEIKKMPMSVLHSDSSSPAEASPVKDPVAGLENLRLKLFENAGADVLKADKSPKQFESALISSKRRVRKKPVTRDQTTVLINREHSPSNDSDQLSTRSGKSSPRCTTPRLESNQQILEEVAQSLDILQKVKRKTEPSKRQKFEDKQFMLRSMVKKTKEDVVKNKVSSDNDCNKSVEKKPAKVSSKSRSTRSSVESVSSVSSGDNSVINSVNDKQENSQASETAKKSAAKPKSVKCSACGHSFKTRELMRKHFPCRVRQTRTWSQNKLRPNRAVKRCDPPKKFVCHLPKSGKADANKHRPQLLTYRKTKFRRVKGKRRRRLYLLIQELKQKRKPVKWPHLCVIYDDLSFKEQCLYKLGLRCIGKASEGLDHYTAEDITLFEQHRAKQKMIAESTLNFQHSLLADSAGDSINDSVTNDTTESENASTDSVMNTSQESVTTNVDSCSGNDASPSKPLLTETALEDSKDVSEKLDENVGDISIDADKLEHKEMHELATSGLYSVGNVSVQETKRSIENEENLAKSEDSAEIPESLEIKADKYSEMDDDFVVPTHVAETETSHESNAPVKDADVNSDVNEPLVSIEAVTSLNDSGNKCTALDMSETVTPEVDDVNIPEVVSASSETKTDVHEEVSNTSKPNSVNSAQDLSNEVQICQEPHVKEDKCVQVTSMDPCDEVSEAVKLDNDNNTLDQNNEVPIYQESLEVDDTPLKVGQDEANIVENPDTEIIQSSAHNVQESIEDDDHQVKEVLEEVACQITDSEQMEIDSNDNNKKDSTQSIDNHSGNSIQIDDNDAKHMEHRPVVQPTTRPDTLQSSVKESPTKNAEMLISINKHKSKYAVSVATDIEFFHQTAQIDKDILEDKHEEKEPDIDTNLIQHASELLQDILGDVEHSVYDGSTGIPPDNTKSVPLQHENKAVPASPVKSLNPLQKPVLTTQTACNNGYVHNTSTPVKRSLKGALKNTGIQALREIDMLSPVKVNENKAEARNDKEVHRPSSEKKKIDFKTYASRRNMMKEAEENEKELHRRNSESHELDDDFLGRLINAVNVIDSIIEDQKECSMDDVNTGFSAITPEMACELSTSKIKHDTELIEQDSMPYDIESFPLVEDDLQNFDEAVETQSCSYEIPSKNIEMVEVAECSTVSGIAEHEETVLDTNFEEAVGTPCSEVDDHLEDRDMSKYASKMDDDKCSDENDICLSDTYEHQDVLENKNVQTNDFNNSINENSYIVSSEKPGTSEENVKCSDEKVNMLETATEIELCSSMEKHGDTTETNNETDVGGDPENVDGEMMTTEVEINTEDDDSVEKLDVCVEDENQSKDDLQGDECCISEDSEQADCNTVSNENTTDPNVETFDHPISNENTADDAVETFDHPISKEECMKTDSESVEKPSDENHSMIETVFTDSDLVSSKEEAVIVPNDASDDIPCGSMVDVAVITPEGTATNEKMITHGTVELYSEATDDSHIEDTSEEESSDDEAQNPDNTMVTDEVNTPLSEPNKDNVALVDSNCSSSSGHRDTASDHTDPLKLSIKESKREFTIRYEMNGLVIKEDLLTGDKNVVENSSPFRSTSESQSTADHSSQLESDVSHMSTPISDRDCSFVNINTNTEPRKHYTAGVDTYEKLENDVTKHDADLDDSGSNSDSENADAEMTVELADISEVAGDESSISSVESTLNDSQDVQNIDKDTEFAVSDMHEEEALEMDHESSSTKVTNDYIAMIDDAKLKSDDAKSITCDSINDDEINEDLNFAETPMASDKTLDECVVISPPTLEKVDDCDTSTDISFELPVIDETVCVEGSPPVLEPEEVDELPEVCLEPKDDHDELAQEEEANKKNTSERHFLDVLENVFEKNDESLPVPKKLVGEASHVENNESECTRNMLDSEIPNDTNIDDSIGRHFSDAIEETQPLSLQSLLDISEKGEVTLAQIKQVLSPVRNKENDTHIQKASLLKIKSSIANLLAKVKTPTKKDPAWLKRDSLLKYTKKRAALQQQHFNDGDDDGYTFTDDEDTDDEGEFMSIENDSTIVNAVIDETCKYDQNNSKGSVTDNILQMLTSLEDKGSLADNMTNLLDILAENLVFLGNKGKNRLIDNDSSDSDSDHSYSNDIVHIPPSTSTENTQKELIADYLDEGEQPPCLDDIPTADDSIVSEQLNESLENDSVKMSANQHDSFDSTGNQQDSFDSTDAEPDLNNQTSDMEIFSSDMINEYTSESSNMESNTINSKKNILMDLEAENETMGSRTTCLNCDKPKEKSYEIAKPIEPKKKASTLFKSITELNSIETDEDSSCDEHFDPIPKLKENSAWEFNSNYSSDREIEDSDTETENKISQESTEAVLNKVADEIEIVENTVGKACDLKVKEGEITIDHTRMDNNSASTKDVEIDSVKECFADEQSRVNNIKIPAIDQQGADEKTSNQAILLENTYNVHYSSMSDQQLELPLFPNLNQESSVKETDHKPTGIVNVSTANIENDSYIVETIYDKECSPGNEVIEDGSPYEETASENICTYGNDDTPSTTESNEYVEERESTCDKNVDKHDLILNKNVENHESIHEHVEMRKLIPDDYVEENERIPYEKVVESKMIPDENVDECELIPNESIVDSKIIPEEHVEKPELTLDHVVNNDLITDEHVKESDSISAELAKESEVIANELAKESEVIPYKHVEGNAILNKQIENSDSVPHEHVELILDDHFENSDLITDELETDSESIVDELVEENESIIDELVKESQSLADELGGESESTTDELVEESESIINELVAESESTTDKLIDEGEIIPDQHVEANGILDKQGANIDSVPDEHEERSGLILDNENTSENSDTSAFGHCDADTENNVSEHILSTDETFEETASIENTVSAIEIEEVSEIIVSTVKTSEDIVSTDEICKNIISSVEASEAVVSTEEVCENIPSTNDSIVTADEVCDTIVSNDETCENIVSTLEISTDEIRANILSIDQNEDSNITMTYEDSEDDDLVISSRLEPNDHESVFKKVEPIKNVDNIFESFGKNSMFTSPEIETVVKPIKYTAEEEKINTPASQTKQPKMKSIDTEDHSNELSKVYAQELKEPTDYIPFENDENSGMFCETIAEKVKRKQRNRCKSVCYNFNPLLYYSSAYAKEAPRTAKKEFSVFRSSILEKRAREKSLADASIDDYECSARKKRYSSVPKDMSSSKHSEFKKNNKDETYDFKWSEISNTSVYPPVDLKPCYVALHRLSEEVIHEHTNRKRKYIEDSEPENRPPIKVTIKLSQIVYPPNSPYGSTSVSSDACRSGYESYSECSDVDDESAEKDNELDTSESQLMTSNTDADVLPTAEGTSELATVEREPLKIKMSTLLTKISHDKDTNSKEIENKANYLSENSTKSENIVVMNSSPKCHTPNKDDLEQTAEKHDSVLFYLSEDSDSNEEINSLKETVSKIVEQQNVINPSVKVKDSVDDFIHGDCGESDVDLSASDSDTDVQDEIDEILNANSKADLKLAGNRSTTESFHPPWEEVVSKKGAMKMIVSDLRLSDSESDSETEITETGNNINKTTTSGNNEPYPVSDIIMAAKHNDSFEVVKNTEDSLETISEIHQESVDKEVVDSDPVGHCDEDETAPNCDILLTETDNCHQIQDSSSSGTSGPNAKNNDWNEIVLPSNDFGSENSQVIKQDATANEIVDNEYGNNRRTSASDDAVKGLESETFKGIKDDIDGNEDELIYYAVEVSDEFETNEAVVNLESVELEQGEVVIEDSQSDLNIVNAVETRVLHSEINDAITEEAFSEEVVEDFPEEKAIDLLEANTHSIEPDKHTPIFYPTVNEIKSKYLYGINEDSQSSNEILEELVMDSIVTDTDTVVHEPVIEKEFDKSVAENHIEEPMDLSGPMDNCGFDTSGVLAATCDTQTSSNIPVHSDNMFTDAVDVTMASVSGTIDICDYMSS